MAYSAKEVLDWITRGETRHLAFRRELADPADLAGVMSSFANHDRGVLLVGIGSAGELLGADVQRAVRVFHLALAQMVNAPKVDLEATNVDNKQVVTITVERSERTTFIRAGAGQSPISPTTALTAFISYKWESEAHVRWVRQFASDLRLRGIDAKLDQWEVRLGESFTEYMQTHINAADVILFVITPDSVAAAERRRAQAAP
jgi:predicted HTH transcriptional regulator